MFQPSFSAIGTITSLNNGLPSRDTCVQGPWPTYLPWPWSKIRVFLRLALAHTPITLAGDITSVGTLWFRVISEIGTCSAMLWTLNVLLAFTPTASAVGIRWWDSKGRSVPRSKMLPRSTWKPSARWPANTFRPPMSWKVCLARSA